MTSNKHNGLSQRIRETIALDGPQTSLAMACKLGVKEQQVTQAVCTMTARTGGLVRSGKIGNRVIYGLAGIHPDCTKTETKPGRVNSRYQREFEELRRDPFEHMKMAMGAR